MPSHESHHDAQHPHLPQNIEPPVEGERDSDLSLGTQLFRFIATGGLSAIVDFGLLTILRATLGFDYSLAKALSFIAGTTTAYAINRRWTFKAEASTKRLIMVWASYLLTFLLQWGIFTLTFPWLATNSTAMFGLSADMVGQTIAFVIAQGAATVCNFVIQRWFIFKVK